MGRGNWNGGRWMFWGELYRPVSEVVNIWLCVCGRRWHWSLLCCTLHFLHLQRPGLQPTSPCQAVAVQLSNPRGRVRLWVKWRMNKCLFSSPTTCVGDRGLTSACKRTCAGRRLPATLTSLGDAPLALAPPKHCRLRPLVALKQLPIHLPTGMK